VLRRRAEQELVALAAQHTEDALIA